MGQLLEALKGIQIPESAKKAVDEADALYTKRTDTASYVGHLEAKIEKLEAEIEKLSAQKGVTKEASGLTFNPKTGTHTDSAGLHYCTKCLSEKKRSPLREDAPEGWRCMVCNAWYDDPNAPPDPPINYDRGGPQGWMR